MTAKVATAVLSVAGLMVGVGCWDNTPPPPRTPVPGQIGAGGPPGTVRETDPIRPLAQPVAVTPAAAPPSTEAPPPAQRPPEQQRFVQVYNQVGRPRIVLFVNRTLQGDVVPASDGQSIWTTPSDPHAPAGSPANASVNPIPNDAAFAHAMDYDAVENVMTDWLSNNGQITLTPPAAVHQRLNDEAIKELQAGRPQVLSTIAQQLDADILIQVAARPIGQTPQGTEVRLVAQAMNVKGGQPIGRAVVVLPQPLLEKAPISNYTPYLAQNLMDDITRTWQAPPPDGFRRPETTPPTGTPAAPAAPAPTTPPPVAPSVTTQTPAPTPPPVASQAPVAPQTPVTPPAPAAPPASAAPQAPAAPPAPEPSK